MQMFIVLVLLLVIVIETKGNRRSITSRSTIMKSDGRQVELSRSPTIVGTHCARSSTG